MSSTKDSVIIEEEKSILLEKLNQCRLQRNFTDFGIKVGKKLLCAHKIVLFESCPKIGSFEKLQVQLPSLVDYMDYVVLEEQFVSPKTMEDLLTYFYTGKLSITIENVKQIYSASKYLNLSKLMSKSEKFFREKVFPENVLEMLLFSIKFQIVSLWNTALKCVRKNWIFLSAGEQLTNLDVKDLKTLVLKLSKEDHMTGPNDEYIWGMNEILFEWIIVWVEHDIDQRSSSLTSLLRCVQFDKLSQEFFNTNVFEEKLIVEQGSSSLFLLEILRKQITPHGSLPLKSTRFENRSSSRFGGWRKAGFKAVRAKTWILYMILLIVLFPFLNYPNLAKLLKEIKYRYIYRPDSVM